jgi:hypothetical protein
MILGAFPITPGELKAKVGSRSAFFNRLTTSTTHLALLASFVEAGSSQLAPLGRDHAWHCYLLAHMAMITLAI